LRQLIQELAPHVKSQPAQALTLCDALWEQPYLEFRILAASLLGQIPPDYAQAVVSRIQSWAMDEPDPRLKDALIKQGMESLRKNNISEMIDLVAVWLSAADKTHSQMGMRALVHLVRGSPMDNFPAFFRLIQPFCRVVSSDLRPDLLDVLSVLAQRSPQETAYFLRQTLAMPDNPDTAWLIRQSLKEFPAPTQTSLRVALREPNLITSW
jgi:hypothetical protein